MHRTTWQLANKVFITKNAFITGLVRDSVPHSNLYLSGEHNKINIVRGCLEDFSTIERALNEYEIDTVFHLGAQTIVGTANRNPLSTFETNIKGTWNVLEAARRVPCVKKVIVASSDKAYGTQTKLPYDEDASLAGEHPYDVSKSCTDLISASYFKSYKLPVCITRCGNLYGGGDLNFNRIIPGTIKAILNNERPIIRSDGSFVRDYFYVEDASLAYIQLAEKMDNPDIHGEAFNFSNEIKLSALEIVWLILKLMGREDLEPIILNQANNEIKQQYLCAQKAQFLLNWQPVYSLEKGLIQTIKWYKEFSNDNNNRKKEHSWCISQTS